MLVVVHSISVSECPDFIFEHFLVYAEMSVRVEIIVSRRHLLRRNTLIRPYKHRLTTQYQTMEIYITRFLLPACEHENVVFRHTYRSPWLLVWWQPTFPLVQHPCFPLYQRKQRNIKLILFITLTVIRRIDLSNSTNERSTSN